MTTVQTIRHSQVWVWATVCVLALLLVVTVLARVAAADTSDPPKDPTTTYIVSPTGGTFVAGSYHGGAPYVQIGSNVEPGTVVGNVEVWGRLHPIYSMVRGTIVEVSAIDETLVVPGQHLFKVQLETEPTPT